MDVLLRPIKSHSVPSVQSYRRLLWDCTRRKALAEVKQVYDHLLKNGLETNSSLGETVVDTLVKCGSLEDALHVFQRLSHRTSLSWTAVISGYSKNGQDKEALRLYQNMLDDGVQPSKYTFLNLLRACGNLSDINEGTRMHEEAQRHGLESDSLLSTALVDMYGSCGDMLRAQRVFDAMPQPDVVSWNALMSGYAQQEEDVTVLQLFDAMQEADISPDARIFVTVLKACGTLASREESCVAKALDTKMALLQKGKTIHAEAVRKGHGSNVFIGSSLVSMYAKCGGIVDARWEFDRLPVRNEVSWNAMIAGYVDQQEFERALEFYIEMQEENVMPNDRTLASLLKACASLAEVDRSTLIDGQVLKLKSLQIGKALHSQAFERGCAWDIFVGTALLSMYVKSGSVCDAECVFEALPAHNELSWSAMIAGYAQREQEDKSFELYRLMREKGVRPNNWILVSMLKVCSSLASREENVLMDDQYLKVYSLQRGRALHAEAAQYGYEGNPFVTSSIIHMYAQCGSIANAKHLFDRLPQRDAVLWNTMIAGYAQQEDGLKALQLYASMKTTGVCPEEATFLSILKACSNIGSRSTCVQIHHDIIASGVWSINLATALIHAYGKCGSMLDAQRVFDSLHQPDTVSWNALIAGHAQQGDYDTSVQCLREMYESGVRPDGFTFHSLLSACNQAGMVDTGLELFLLMGTHYGIPPSVGHYAVMVDLLGRSGLLDQAENLITKMPMQPNLAIWLSLLGSCRSHGNVVLARRAFECSVQLAPQHSAAYILMSNIYAHAGMWDCAHEIDELRRKAAAWKRRGQSWLQHGPEVDTFEVGDSSHQHSEVVFGMLKQLSSENDMQADVSSS